MKRFPGKIQIMDDNEDVRETASYALQSLGCRVVPAEDGIQAIQLYQQAMRSGEGFDGVIMDLAIPGGMGGKETIERLFTIDPHVKNAF